MISNPSNNERGFSLIEVLISLGLASFLITIALSQNLSLAQTQYRYVSRSNLAQDALGISSFFTEEIGQTGGGSVRPWMSVWLENNCAARGSFPDCQGSDRLTLTSSTIPVLESKILSMPAPDVFQLPVIAGTCGGLGILAGNPYVVNFMLTQSNSYAQVKVISIDPLLCKYTFVPGTAAGNDSVPAVANWTGGTATIVNVETLYWKKDTTQILQQPDHPCGNFLPTTFTMMISQPLPLVLADQVLDLQFSLGLDLNGDGNVVDLGTTTDSYLFNAAGENWGAGTYLNAKSTMLKTVGMALITGTKANYGGSNINQMNILDGPVRDITGWDARKVMLKFTPRNNYFYQ